MKNIKMGYFVIHARVNGNKIIIIILWPNSSNCLRNSCVWLLYVCIKYIFDIKLLLVTYMWMFSLIKILKIRETRPFDISEIIKIYYNFMQIFWKTIIKKSSKMVDTCQTFKKLLIVLFIHGILNLKVHFLRYFLLNY